MLFVFCGCFRITTKTPLDVDDEPPAKCPQHPTKRTYTTTRVDDQVLADVMTALCDNLRPAPFHYGTIALRLLGKLGGRNRRFLSEPMLLPPSTGTSWHTHDCFKVIRVNVRGFGSRDVRIEMCLLL